MKISMLRPNAFQGKAGVFARALCAGAFVVGLIGVAQAQVTGTINIPGGAYPDLAAAITDVNAVGVGAGGATLNLLAGNAQTAPAGGYSITTLTTSAANPLAIVGNSNTVTANAALTGGALNDAIFKIIGSDNVTLSGFTMNENAANTITAAGTNNMTEFGVALFYASATDNAQNITIQNNVITLNRAYQNTFGIYANATHTATAVTTTATATGAGGGNSGLKIYSNTISNVNNGISVVGPTAAADANDGVDIGGASAATANTLSNFGTTNAFSGYANVSLSVNGVLIRNSKNFNVSFNSISSSTATTIPTATNAGTLRAIYVPSFSAAPTGTISNSMNNNAIALRGGAVGVVLQGVIVEPTTGNITTTVNINNNNFTDASWNAAATAASTYISQTGIVLNSNLNNNTFSNLIVNSTSAVTFFIHTFTLPTGGTKNVNGNSIITAFSKTGVGGTVTLHTDNGSSPAGTFSNNNNNNFSNITLTGTTGLAGWANLDGVSAAAASVNKTVSGNTFANWTNGGSTSAITGLSVGFGGPQAVSNNLVNSFTGGGTITGITTGSSFSSLFSQNTVNTLTSSGPNTVSGMICASGTTVNFSRNKIFGLTGNNGSSAVNGMTVSSGTTVNVFNNIIGDLFLPTSGATNSLVGLNLSGGTTVNASYNTVRLAATSSGLNFGSAAVSASATPSVTLRNNNFVNASTPAGTGLTVAYRRSSATLTSYGATSNNNNFYAGTPSATNVIFFDGTTSDQTLTAYKGRVASRDSASVTESPPFVSTTGSNANFLHISLVTATQLEGNGTAVSGITDDFDGDVRNASTPDIGADEFNGIQLDLNGPAIAYTSFGNTTLFSNRVLAVTISDPSGVAGGGNAPRIYFRKNAGSYFSTTCSGAAPSFSCTIDNALLGGVVTADVINYFVIAQDTLGNVSASPGTGLAAADVNTVTTPPTTPASYLIAAPFPSTVNVGTGETITSLTNPSGLFALINAGVLTSNVVVNITSDLALETGANALNALAEEPAASNFTLRISPASSPRVITGAFNGVLIRLNGASRVTIDGSIGGTGTDRSLTIQNTNTSLPGVLLVGSVASTPITNVTLKNSIIINGATTSSAVVISDATSTGAAGFFSNITIQNNDVQRASVGIFASGGTTPQGGSNLVYTQNTVNTSGANAVRIIGLYMQGVNGATVTQNTVGNFSAVEGENDTGIWLATGTANATVSGNTVNNLGMTLTTAFAPFGIRESSGVTPSGSNFSGNTVTNLSTTGSTAIRGIAVSSSGVTIQRNIIQGINNNNINTFGAYGIDVIAGNDDIIQNNFISDINHVMTGGSAFSTDFGVFGIRLGAGTGHKVYFNSVNLFGLKPGTANSALLSTAFGIVATTQTGIDVRNNIFANNVTGGTTSLARVSVYLPTGGTSAMNLTWNNNAYYFGTDAVSQGIAQVGNTAGTGFLTTLPALVAYTSTLSAAGTNDNASLAATTAVPFVSSTDLHVGVGSAVVNVGTPIAGVSNDIDGDVRSATTPEIGADELPSYTVGGIVSGLVGTGLVLQNNLGNNLNITANGSFTFTARLDSGAAYSVTVLTQPGTPSQTCAVSNGSGTIAAANVTDVAVSCTTNTYTVGGSVTGLTGTGLVLHNNGGDNLAISANGAFTFATPVASGATYAVTVLTQPGTPTQTCAVSNGAGTVGAANVTNVTVSCTTNTYTVGGNVTGLTGTGLVLRNNGGDNLAISANGTFTFATPVASGATYAVTVLTQPGTPTQTCAVSNGGGTVAAANVTNVTVSCTTNTYTVGGNVTGLTGAGLVLRNNGGDNLAISANGAFTFATTVASGATYAVTVFTQPGTPAQTCAVSNGSGTIAAANVTNVTVSCTTNTYTVGGSVTGLTGTGLVLRNNGGDNLAISANGTFTFATPLTSGATYAVTVFTQPGTPTQTCAVSNGSGTVAAANVTNVTVSCTTNTYTVGGNVTGLTGTGLVLRNSGGDNLSVSANGTFTFATSVASGAAYAVTVFTQPSSPTQTCSVGNGTGTVGAANITTVSITCSANSFTVGGSVSGLTGSGLVLRNNGGDNLAISANGAFTFATPVASGATYAVTVLTQPGTPTQTCAVSNGVGTVGAANVTNVTVSCTTNTYTVGGSVTGLTGTGLVLRNNGGDNLSVSANGAFTFATPVASGATYAVTVFTQPGTPAQTCAVSNGSGTVGSANVTSVSLACVVNNNTANLDVSKDDGVTTYRAGDLLVYTLVLRNLGPDSANGVVFTDIVPATLINATWTCAAANGAACPQTGGSGSINATIAALPATGRLTYTLQANVATPIPAQISNTAQVSITGLPIIDPQLSNNSATDTNLPEAIFRNGFEDPIVLQINKASGQQSIALASLSALLDATARSVFSADDVNGEALRVYGRSNDAGEVELALAVRGSDGLLRLGAWQRFTGSVASISYVASAASDGFVLQSARFD